MATFPWAVARPFSYFVSPEAVISIGCLSEPACPNAGAQAQNNPKTVKTSLRIAGCEATEGGQGCKGENARHRAAVGAARPGSNQAVMLTRSPATCWLSPQLEM